MTALRVDDLHVAYGAHTAVTGVSFEIEPGACTSVLGVNGAGKSSLVSAIVGWTAPAHGTVVVNGVDLTGASPPQTVAAGVALVPERRQLFAPLSVQQNLTLGGYRMSRAARNESLDRVLEMFPDLSGRLSDRAGNLSGGQQQMLAIGRALMSEPNILLLDEPSLGLAPLIVQGLGEMLRTIVANGTALLIVEQNSRLAIELSSEVLVLVNGEVAAQGEPKALLSDNTEVLEMFLGHDTTASST